VKEPKNPDFNQVYCPLPLPYKEKIVLSHGSGGRMTKDLIDSIFNQHFSNPMLDKQNDFADFMVEAKTRIVISTDAHIVSPLFFPGGDIGRLAVAGSVNDTAMSGAQPKFLTATFILEEGFNLKDLEKIANSMAETAQEAGIEIIAADTKVAEKGKADQIFISTTAIGIASPDLIIGGECAQPGDVLIISGSIGDHGIAILAARNQLGFRTTIQSDVAPLNHLIQAVLETAPNIHVLRDPTRGGLATTLNEIAAQSQVNFLLEEDKIPVKKEVQAACELLGFDPLYVANEGKVLIILPEIQSEAALKALKKHPFGREATLIGKVTPMQGSPRVRMHTSIGGTRIVDMLSGEMLPRIC